MPLPATSCGSAGTRCRRRDGRMAADDFFYAEQNARLVRNAEHYYRSMFRGRVSSWNLRDRHMAETLDFVVEHLALRGTRAKVVVWAHNSHLGDARATQAMPAECFPLEDLSLAASFAAKVKFAARSVEVVRRNPNRDEPRFRVLLAADGSPVRRTPPSP